MATTGGEPPRPCPCKRVAVPRLWLDCWSSCVPHFYHLSSERPDDIVPGCRQRKTHPVRAPGAFTPGEALPARVSSMGLHLQGVGAQKSLQGVRFHDPLNASSLMGPRPIVGLFKMGSTSLGGKGGGQKVWFKEIGCNKCHPGLAFFSSFSFVVGGHCHMGSLLSTDPAWLPTVAPAHSDCWSLNRLGCRLLQQKWPRFLGVQFTLGCSAFKHTRARSHTCYSQSTSSVPEQLDQELLPPISHVVLKSHPFPQLTPSLHFAYTEPGSAVFLQGNIIWLTLAHP